jgi:hypothetical protein
MIEVSHLNEQEGLTALPQAVQETIIGILQILDTEYGAGRDKHKDDGGYVAILEKEEEFQQIKDKDYIDCNDIIPEYVDKVIGTNDEIFTNSLIICNNDYTITLVMRMELTTENLKLYN